MIDETQAAGVAIAIVDTKALEELRVLTGEDTLSGGNTFVPFVKLIKTTDSGLTVGHYYISDGKDEDGKTVMKEIGPEYCATVLKVRIALKGFKDEVAISSNEFDSWKPINGFDVNDAGVIKHFPNIDEAIEAFPTPTGPALKKNYVLYLLEDGAPRKMYVQGLSLGTVMTYMASFQRGKESMSQFVTHFTSHEEQKMGKKFQVMNMKRGIPADMTKVLPALQSLQQATGIDSYVLRTADEMPDNFLQ